MFSRREQALLVCTTGAGNKRARERERERENVEKLPIKSHHSVELYAALRLGSAERRSHVVRIAL